MATTEQLRPQHRTVRRQSLGSRPIALAAKDGTCACGGEVLEDEPIIHVGSVIDEDPDTGERSVDLTGSEWRCQRCIGGAA